MNVKMPPRKSLRQCWNIALTQMPQKSLLGNTPDDIAFRKTMTDVFVKPFAGLPPEKTVIAMMGRSLLLGNKPQTMENILRGRLNAHMIVSTMKCRDLLPGHDEMHIVKKMHDPEQFAPMFYMLLRANRLRVRALEL